MSVLALAGVARAEPVKWHPGHYVLGTKVDEYKYVHVAALKDEPNIMGWEQLVSWARLEPARGQYDWSLIDGLLEQCHAEKKHLIVQLLDRTFAGTNPARLPAYLAAEPGGEGGWYLKPSGGVIAKIWLPAVMDRLVALYRAIGARYDGDPYFEGVFTAESDLGFRTGPPDYSPAFYVRQLDRFVDALPEAFPHTNVWLSVNFFPAGHAALTALIERARAHRLGLAGPDAVTGNEDRSDMGTRVLRGLKWNGREWLPGGTDHRGAIPIAHDVEGPEMGGKHGSFTLDEIYAHSYEVNHDSHLIWLRKDYLISKTGGDLLWARDILPWLQKGGHPTHTECPRIYTDGCNTE